MTARDEGLFVQRWFEPYESPGKAATEFRAGELVRVRVRVATRMERHYVAVEVPLPAGLEAVDLQLATSAQQPTSAHQERNEGEGEEGLRRPGRRTATAAAMTGLASTARSCGARSATTAPGSTSPICCRRGVHVHVVRRAGDHAREVPPQAGQSGGDVHARGVRPQRRRDRHDRRAEAARREVVGASRDGDDDRGRACCLKSTRFRRGVCDRGEAARGAALGAGLLAIGIAIAIPVSPERLALAAASSLRIEARDGTVLREMVARHGDGHAAPAHLDELPPQIWQAFVAAEDGRFFSHPGIDPLALGRAVAVDLRRRKLAQGGSGLAQQLARMIEPRPRSVLGKASEALLALRLMRTLGHRAVLEQYLSRVPLGNDVRGVESAARLYFDRPARALTPLQAALLAAIPRGPSAFNPLRHGGRAREAADRVLAAMAGARFSFDRAAGRCPRRRRSIWRPRAFQAAFQSAALRRGDRSRKGAARCGHRAHHPRSDAAAKARSRRPAKRSTHSRTSGPPPPR